MANMAPPCSVLRTLTEADIWLSPAGVDIVTLNVTDAPRRGGRRDGSGRLWVTKRAEGLEVETHI